MNDQPASTRARVLGPTDGEILGPPERSDRFMLDGPDTENRLAVVQHTLGPRVLAAPMHRHTREDEYSYVLEGQLAAMLGDEVVVAEAGWLVHKPRGQWHTFWNPGDTPTRVLELITPAGLEVLFRELGRLGDEYDMETLPALAAAYGCDLDFEATMTVVQDHGLDF